MSCAESRARLPVLRPLIGLDKESIIKYAVKIGTYKTSILPYPDCCTVFTPQHPIIHARLADAAAMYDELKLAPLLSEALGTTEEDF
jgi:thiamine biosynthesis protein ThiI